MLHRIHYRQCDKFDKCDKGDNCDKRDKHDPEIMSMFLQKILFTILETAYITKTNFYYYRMIQKEIYHPSFTSG